MQVVENLAILEGTLIATQRHPTLADYDVATFQVARVEPVEGLPSLIHAKPGERLDVTIRRELLGADSTPGARFRFRAKRTQNGVMCEPHPLPGEFRISLD